MSESQLWDLDHDSLAPKEIPVKYDGIHYVLCEASEIDAIKLNEFQFRNSKVVDGKLQLNVHGIRESQSMLVSMCLYELDDSSRKSVPQGRIKGWPQKIVRMLFDKCQEISGMRETSEERKQLDKALSLAEAPLSLKELRAFVNGLDSEDYQDLKDWLEPTEEEKAKNEHVDSQAT